MPIAIAPTAKLAVISTNGSSLARTVASQYVAQINVLPSANATPMPSTRGEAVDAALRQHDHHAGSS